MRLEAAARDYAIAVLSRGNAEEALDAATCVSEEAIEIVTGVGRDFDYAGRDFWTINPRLLRARLALYLRLLRRIDAWEEYRNRAPDLDPFQAETMRRRLAWAEPPHAHALRYGPHPEYPGFCIVYELRSVPWRPLWLDAPAFDPEWTPRRRREAREPG